ncbi:MAG: shikimate kinase [Eubacteriales bacterium]|nr:shikimate kinase [Eubacteriales bacterium]
MKGRYGLIGRRLGHSYSPQIHALIGDYEYKLYPMEEEEIPAFLQGDLAGMNVTIPYKETVIPFLSEISPEARRIGSVNTIVRGPGGALIGHNTDYFGFAWLLGESAHLTGKKALILGSGGTSKTACAVLADRGMECVVVSRRGENNYENLHLHADAAVVVNTTPVGMFPEVEAAPVDLRAFPQCRLVLDAIYNPARTSLLLQAEALGIECRGGIGMLAAQAVKAAEIWGLRSPDEPDPVADIAAAVQRSMRSIALIGMPGSGKSSIGRLLAERTGRKFIDTDELIVELAGRPIPEIFAQEGERAFRAVETQALRMAARESGAVIATGGGIVTVPENRQILRRNCTVLYIERPLSELPIAGRPLSQGRGVEQLFAERAPLYESWCEARYANTTVGETVARIEEDWA